MTADNRLSFYGPVPVRSEITASDRATVIFGGDGFVSRIYAAPTELLAALLTAADQLSAEISAGVPS